MSVLWRFQAFDTLTAAELYAVLRLRSEVFVVEQSCVFQDMDNSDAQAMHLMGHADDTGAVPSGDISCSPHPRHALAGWATS